jgi:hypothetical protein
VALGPVAGGTIVDVSRLTTLRMNPGDTLYFPVSNLSLPAVDAVEFQFISQTPDPMPQFEAELSSRDGVTSIAFPAVQISTGIFVGSGYRGPIWSISGTLQLPGTLSTEVFQNGRAMLVLRDLGPTVTLGLPGYTLPGALTLSLTDGATSAGAFTGGALYEDPPAPAATPESGSWLLTAGAGVLLCMFSTVLKRISYRGIQ